MDPVVTAAPSLMGQGGALEGLKQPLPRDTLAVPEGIKTIIIQSDALIGRLGLSPEMTAHVSSVFKSVSSADRGFDQLEMTLFSSLLRASPEVKRLLEWASSARPPTGALALHAGAFALVGSIYFHARLVKHDAALASRVVDDYGVQVPGARDLKGNFVKFLKELVREPNSFVGAIVANEYGDKNSGVLMHVLGGILAPLFAEISRETRATKSGTFARLLQRLSAAPPTHLADVVLLESLEQGHVDVLAELSTDYAAAVEQRKAEAIRQNEAAAEQAAKKTEQERQARQQQEDKAKQEREQREREERQKAQQRQTEATLNLPTSLITALLSAFKEDLAMQKHTQRYVQAAEGVVRATWDIISQHNQITDEALYLILESLPRGTKATGRGVMNLGFELVNDVRYREGIQRHATGAPSDSISLGLVFEALRKLVVVKDPERFARVPSDALKYLAANADYDEPMMGELRRAVIAFHGKRRLELLKQ